MKRKIGQAQLFNSISDLHRALGLPKPLHPLVSLVDYGMITKSPEELPAALILNFYKISYKQNLKGRIKYGQGYYDFDEGGMSFISPMQLIAGTEEEKDYGGFTLLIHPDFIRNTTVGAHMHKYGFFDYASNEALYPSDKEKKILLSVFENIKVELESSIDVFSQDVIISHIEVLLNYSQRFYTRQFITRKTASSDLLTQMESLLTRYFDHDEVAAKGLPSVQYFSDQLNVSARYLGDMLKSLTGQNTQQHIHAKLIEKAKTLLSTTSLSIGEIAYKLGFEHPQSFNKLFKKKVKSSPVEFRQSFN
jgi:AraC family transcriptional activator of pobA